jgi:hypothetical protein
MDSFNILYRISLQAECESCAELQEGEAKASA